jgi:hypothetical protein
MNPAQEKIAILKVEFPTRSLAHDLLGRWSASPGVLLNIRRGRVTAEEARFELEIRGNAALVAKLVRQSAPWNAERRFLSPVPAIA